MKITSLETTPFHTLPYLNAGPRGAGVEVVPLPFFAGTVDALPEGLAAVVLCADLQGREPGPESRLLGEVVCDELRALADEGELPDLADCGALLAGDFYAVPGCVRRGGLGDVLSVWRAFTDPFRWAAGVVGNHDQFGDDPSGIERYRRNGPGHLLDGDLSVLDGLRVGGVSGIVGHPSQPNRRDGQAFQDLLLGVLSEGPEVLVLHDGPWLGRQGFRGDPDIRLAVEQASEPLLLVRGHKPWPERLADLTPSVQVVNTHEAVIVLRA